LPIAIAFIGPRYPRRMPSPTPLTAQDPRICFLSSPSPEARAACAALVRAHGDHSPEDADVLVPLGGDGFMLQTLHRYASLGKPFYGMKLGTVGFLMNQDRKSVVE